MNISILIQCRDESNRLPYKSVMPFYKNKSILELLIKRFKHLHYKTYITTKNISTKTIEICKKMDIPYFLEKKKWSTLYGFLQASKKFNLDGVFRVCADNPFIQLGLFYMIQIWAKTGEFDYISYNDAMHRHEGFYIEYVSIKALEVANNNASEDDVNHPTEYIRKHPELFNIKILDIPKPIQETNIRLTVDTLSDFKIAQLVYGAVGDSHWFHILDYINAHPKLLRKMKKNIKRNPK